MINHEYFEQQIKKVISHSTYHDVQLLFSRYGEDAAISLIHQLMLPHYEYLIENTDYVQPYIEGVLQALLLQINEAQQGDSQMFDVTHISQSYPTTVSASDDTGESALAPMTIPTSPYVPDETDMEIFQERLSLAIAHLTDVQSKLLAKYVWDYLGFELIFPLTDQQYKQIYNEFIRQKVEEQFDIWMSIFDPHMEQEVSADVLIANELIEQTQNLSNEITNMYPFEGTAYPWDIVFRILNHDSSDDQEIFQRAQQVACAAGRNLQVIFIEKPDTTDGQAKIYYDMIGDNFDQSYNVYYSNGEFYVVYDPMF